jgi:hypothetical protein
VITRPLRELSEAYMGTAHTTQPTAPASITGRRPIRSDSLATGRVMAIPAAAPMLAAVSIVFWGMPSSFGPYERL